MSSYPPRVRDCRESLNKQRKRAKRLYEIVTKDSVNHHPTDLKYHSGVFNNHKGIWALACDGHSFPFVWIVDKTNSDKRYRNVTGGQSYSESCFAAETKKNLIGITSLSHSEIMQAGIVLCHFLELTFCRRLSLWLLWVSSYIVELSRRVYRCIAIPRPR